MPTISRENIDALNAVITIELPKNDYLPQVEQKMKDYRKKASIKGFRPGQVPMGFIRQKFGDSILSDEVNEIVRNTLNDYFKQENLQFLGQPMPITSITININKPQDYSIKFELGLTPEFEIQGMSLDNVLPYYDVEVSDEIVDKEVENLRKRFGDGYEEDVLDIQEDDLILVDLVELDEENQEVKEGGHSREEATISIRDIQNAELKDKILTATVGDVFNVNPYHLDKGDQESVRKYLLDVSNRNVVSELFRLTIRTIRRMKKAELTPTFFKQIFPDQTEPVLDENGVEEIQPEMDLDTFRNRIREEIYKAYRREIRTHFYRTVHKSLVDLNKFDLPEAFLKKWLKQTRNVPDQELEEGFDVFAQNIRWSLVRDKIAERFQVEVTKEDVEMMVRSQVLRYFNYQVSAYSDVVNTTVERIMSDEQEVQRRYEGILDERVLEHAAEEIGKEVKMLTREEFEAMVKAENEAKNKAEEITEEKTETTEAE